MNHWVNRWVNCWVLGAALCVLPLAAHAQTPATTPPPRDPLKNIPLAGSNPLTLTLGGQLRWREEFYRGFNTLDINDDNGQSRLLLSADVVAGRKARGYARFFTEWRDDQSFGRTLPGGARPQDADRHDFQTLQGEIGHGASYLRIGRQEIALANQRLIGVPDWSNTRRSSEGARLYLAHGPLALEAVDARPLIVRQFATNRADSTQHFRTLSLGNASGAKPLAPGLPAVWQAYWYEQAIHPLTGARTYRITTGGRVQWNWGGSKAALSRALEFEGAAQRGTVGARDIHAYFAVAEGTLQWKRVHGAPSLALGVEQASGENPNSTNTIEAFSVLYPAAHAHGGYADVIGRTNTRELHVFSIWDPLAPLNLRLALYRFDRVRLDDAAYNKQNAIFPAAGTSRDRHIADELDLTGTYKVGNHIRVVAGYGLVAPGEFLERTNVPSRTEHWGFTGATLLF